MFKLIIKGISVLIAVIVLVLSFFILLSSILTLLMPEGWLFYEINTLWAYMIAAVCVVDLARIAVSKNYRKTTSRKNTIISVGLLIASTYIFITNPTIVTEDHIIVRSPLNPVGSVYEYSDVEQINAYFTEDTRLNQFLQKPGGTFIYEIQLAGKEYEFQSPTINTNGKYAETDAYTELEDFDEKLVALTTPKKSNEDHYDLNELDLLYKGIFHRIVSNK